MQIKTDRFIQYVFIFMNTRGFLVVLRLAGGQYGGLGEVYRV